MTVQLPDLTPEQLAEAARLYAEKNPSQPQEGDESKLPEWARKAIKKGNDEAAEYRTKLRAAEDKLKDAKTPEDIAAATKEWQEKFEASEKSKSEAELNAARTVAKVTYGLNDRVAASLKGATAAEIEADAKGWATDLGLVDDKGNPVAPTTERTPRTPSGGRSGSGFPAGGETYDPAALALEVEKHSGRR